MSVEKTAPVTIPPFQPRLAPRPVRPHSFKDTLDDVLGVSHSNTQIPNPPPTRSAEIPLGGPVRGVIHGMTVAAPIDHAVFKSHAASEAGQPPAKPESSDMGQFNTEDEAALQAWASRVKVASHQGRRAKTPSESAASGKTVSTCPAASGGEGLSPAEAAAAQLGKRYVPGGESPRRGFDCSGLTSYAYAQSGLELPHSSREQFRQGKPVDRNDLRKGDLVFFGKKGVHHVGIYTEGGRFVHAATSKGTVQYGSLDDPVWAGSYAGARRML